MCVLSVIAWGRWHCGVIMYSFMYRCGYYVLFHECFVVAGVLCLFCTMLCVFFFFNMAGMYNSSCCKRPVFAYWTCVRKWLGVAFLRTVISPFQRWYMFMTDVSFYGASLLCRLRYFCPGWAGSMGILSNWRGVGGV